METKIPARLRLVEGGLVKLEAPDPKDVRTFRMAAYTGAEVETFWGRMILDLEGVKFSKRKMPILQHHDVEKIVGYAESAEKTDEGLVIEGRLSSRTAAGREVAELADEGFPWQASIGFDIGKVRAVNDGDVETVNGREFKGPGVVVQSATVYESSFVPLGADGATSAVVLAACDDRFVVIPTKETNMSIEEFAKANPEAVQKWQAEGYEKAKAELAPKPATVNELRAAFADNGFVIDQLAANATMADAALAYVKVASEKLAKAETEMAALRGKLEQATSGSAPVATAAATAATSKPAEDWKSMGFKTERAFQLWKDNQANVHIFTK